MAFAVVLAGCSGAGDKSVDGEVLVSAAASLTNAFGAIEVAFEEANPGVDVVLNLGSSSGLREQILEGAPVDVFASANTSNMDQVVEAGIKAILNFSPGALKVPAEVKLKSVDLTVSLESLSFYLAQGAR